MKPTILLIGNLLSATLGVRSVSEDLAARLSAKGWRVLTASEKSTPLARVADMVATAWQRRREYAVANVEVFSGRAFCWAEAVCLLLRLLAKPYILTLHGGNLPAFARRWPRRVRWLLRSAAFVTAPSRYLQEQMAVYRSDLLVLPNPLNLEAYEFRLRTQASPRLVWLRSFHKQYNPTLAPRAVEQLTHEFSEVRLRMIGPDKGDGSAQEVQRLIASLGLSERITRVGAIAKSIVSRHLNEGDIFLNTTNTDNTPVSVLEAMACGLCVVSTNVGGIPYLLEDECDALLVPPEDSQAMAAAVRRILTTPALAETLSRNARGKAEQFDWSVILPKWERLFEDCAKRDRGHGKF
ncbi:MAG: glycosyltransferase family 4 protein [Blastocatellia bacterium]